MILFNNKIGKTLFSLIICFFLLSPAVMVSGSDHITSPGSGNGNNGEVNNNGDGESGSTTGGFFGICSITGEGNEISAMPLSECFPRVFAYIFRVLGLLAMGILVYAGYVYMTAGGDGTKIANSKRLIQGVLTGILLLALSYVLLKWLDPRFVDLTNLDRLTDIDVKEPPAQTDQD